MPCYHHHCFNAVVPWAPPVMDQRPIVLSTVQRQNTWSLSQKEYSTNMFFLDNTAHSGPTPGTCWVPVAFVNFKGGSEHSTSQDLALSKSVYIFQSVSGALFSSSMIWVTCIGAQMLSGACHNFQLENKLQELTLVQAVQLVTFCPSLFQPNSSTFLFTTQRSGGKQNHVICLDLVIINQGWAGPQGEKMEERGWICTVTKPLFWQTAQTPAFHSWVRFSCTADCKCIELLWR